MTGKTRVPARVYAMDKNEVEGEADVVEGTLTISEKLAKLLIDPGSTHSFVRPGFIKRLGFKTENLPYLIEVSTPIGEKKIETKRIYRKCYVELCERIFPIDLISLTINGYDVILGMDCRTKDISLCVPLRLNFKKSHNQWD